MSATVTLAWKSLRNRKATAFLTVLTVAISVILLLGVEKIRTQAKESFANTISGTDLIVGGRFWPSKPLTVFGISHRQCHQQY